jgi:hypothetical protein
MDKDLAKAWLAANAPSQDVFCVRTLPATSHKIIT